MKTDILAKPYDVHGDMAAMIALILLSFIWVPVSGSLLTYRAAVLEYHPVKKVSEVDTVAANVNNYVRYMAEAKSKKAEIIVFPEGGLLAKETRSYIPDPVDRVVPCDSKDSRLNKVVKDLSCASKNSMIYSVVNLIEKRECAPDDENCPEKRYYVFNTNVVFDRTGMVIARYSKYNLFDEFATDRTKDPEMGFFDTDFGVRFGTFTCFDILFSTPAQRLVQQYRITDFVFPTFWFSELPFLTALQAQRGWAEANGVNLLASGVNEPGLGSGGSGIYNGRFGQIVQVMPETSTSRLLVADVPRVRDDTCSTPCRTGPVLPGGEGPFVPSASALVRSDAAPQEDFKLLQDQMHLFESAVVEGGKTVETTVCSHEFCCDFEITMDALKPESKNYTCRAVAFNGVRRFGLNFRGGVQVCGVVMCNGPDVRNCTRRAENIPGLFRFKKIHIKGTFNPRNSFQMPSTLTDGKELTPLPANKYEFTQANTEKGSEVSLELVWPVTDLRTFAIWGRDFTRDMEPLEPESGASAILGTPVLFASLAGFLLFAR